MLGGESVAFGGFPLNKGDICSVNLIVHANLGSQLLIRPGQKLITGRFTGTWWRSLLLEHFGCPPAPFVFNHLRMPNLNKLHTKPRGGEPGNRQARAALTARATTYVHISEKGISWLIESCWSGEHRHLTRPRKKKKNMLLPEMSLFPLFLDDITFYITNQEEGVFYFVVVRILTD